MGTQFLEKVDKEVIHIKALPTLKVPRFYKVFMLNDDYTPMDFVVLLLKKFFGFSEERAVVLMMQVHTQGKAICGIYPRDVAEFKACQVIEYARGHQHPLMCVIEPE